MAAINKPVVCPIVVGRGPALSALDSLAASVGTGRGQSVLISGEAGIGKSRLVAKASEEAVARKWAVLRASCFEQDMGLPYALPIDLLYNLMSSGAATAVSLLTPVANDLVRLAPELSQLVPSATPAVRLDPEQEKRRLFDAILNVVTADLPVLVAVEDLHWSDESSLDFLLHLARRIQNQPLLLLLTYRNDEVGPSLRRFLAELDRERLAVELPLERLSLAEVDSMLRATLSQNRSVRADFLHALFKLTEGNPFFVEEVLRSVLSEMGGEAELQSADLHDVPIPRTVAEAVQRRTENLTPPVRELIRLAAVAGTRFDFDLLQQVSSRDESELLAAVHELIGQQLVVEEPGDRFSFRHALTREAIRTGLLARERRVLHGRIAGAIEAMHPADTDKHAEDLAHHFAEAEIWDRALGYLRIAGQRALEVYAPGAAIEYFNRAIEAAARIGSSSEVHLFLNRAAAHDAAGDFERARSDYEQTLKLAEAAANKGLRVEALLAIGLLWSSRDYGRAGRYYQQAVMLARESGDKRALGHALNRLGNWHGNTGDYAASRRLLDEAFDLFQGTEDERGMAETLDLLGMASLIGAEITELPVFYRQAVQRFESLGDKRGMISALATLSVAGGTYQTDIMESALTLPEAIGSGRRAVALAREVAVPADEAYALWQLAFALGPHGDYAAAIAAARESLDIARNIEHTQWIIAGNLALAGIYLDLLHPHDALPRLEEALGLAQAVASDVWLPQAITFLTRAYIQSKQYERASELLMQTPGRSPVEEFRTWSQCHYGAPVAELALARGDFEASLALVRRIKADQARPTSEKRFPALRLERLEALALAALGDYGEAIARFEIIEEAAATVENRSYLWRVAADLASANLAAGNHERAKEAAGRAFEHLDFLAANIADAGLREHFLAQASTSIPGPLRRRQTKGAPDEAEGLTAREVEIAALVARGRSNRAIAEELVLSVRTVETHVANAMSKMGFTTRSQLAAWAVERGLLNSNS